jgi:hypothetical protein
MKEIVRLEGVLTTEHHKGHVPCRFAVPEGVTRLSIRLDASPARAAGAAFDNLISLSLFGPAGPRGARHNNPEWDLVVDAHAATPGYLPGPIEAGEWTLYLDTFRILGPDPVAYRADIAFGFDPAPHVAAPVPRLPAPRGPGWYRGDLHAHSEHSDASWTVPDFIAFAQRQGLDFATITDHNTPSSHHPAMALGGDDLLVMGGIELTTHFGHALTLGGRGWHEWRAGSMPGVSMTGIAEAAIAAGRPFVIAHPMAPGDPACTGCRWEFAEMTPGPARLVEVWNGGVWSDYNEEGLALVRSWLRAGHRLRLTAGTDIHGHSDESPLMGFNHVHARALTEEAILEAVAAGRNYLSSGPRLVLAAGDAPMGGVAAPGEALTAEIATGAEALTLRLVTAAGVVLESAVAPETATVLPLGAMPEGFAMAELRAVDGTLRAVTNPIFA